MRAVILFLLSFALFLLTWLYASTVIDIFDLRIFISIALMWGATIFCHYVSMRFIVIDSKKES